MHYEWPGKLIYNPDKGIITWRRDIVAKEHKRKDDKSKMKPKKKESPKDCYQM